VNAQRAINEVPTKSDAHVDRPQIAIMNARLRQALNVVGMAEASLLLS
jgi:hypothetical protein